MKAEEIGDLAKIFTDASAVFDMALNMGAPVHGMFLSLASGLAVFAGLFGIAYATIGKTVGYQVDPGGVFRSVIIISILLIPYDIADYFQSDYLAQRGEYQSKINEVASTAGIVLPDKASHHNVSLVLFHFHRLVTFVSTSLIDIVNTFTSPDKDKQAGLPSWVFEVWHAGYANTMKDTKPFYDLWTDYIRLCGPVAATNKEVSPRVWRMVGLLGGTGLGHPETQGEGDFIRESDGESLGLASQRNSYWLTEMKPARDLLLKEILITKGVTPQQNGYYVPSREYWNTKADNGNEASSESLYINNPYDDLRWTPMQDTNIESLQKEKAFFTDNCDGLYRINNLAFVELRASMQGKIRTYMINGNGMGKYRGSEVDNDPNTRQLGANIVYETSMVALGAKPIESTFLGNGQSILQWWQELKLLAHVPMMFGAITIAYAFLIMLFPIIAALAALPGRGASITLYAHSLVYAQTVVFLLYFILKVGSMMLLGMGVSLANATGGGSIFTKGIASQALALETVLIMAVVGVFPIAYFLVFSDKAGLKGLSSKGLDAAGHAAKTLATVAGTAVMASRALGVSKMAGAAKDALSSGSKAMQQSTDAAVSAGISHSIATQNPVAGRTSAWAEGTSGGNRIDAAAKMASAARKGTPGSGTGGG
jgi:hypothetical protein